MRKLILFVLSLMMAIAGSAQIKDTSACNKVPIEVKGYVNGTLANEQGLDAFFIDGGITNASRSKSVYRTLISDSVNYDNGTYSSSVGSSSVGSTLWWGIRISPSRLLSISDSLTEIRVYSGENTISTLYVCSGSSTAPLTVLRSGTIDFNTGWNELTLNTPVSTNLDTNSLWIVIKNTDIQYPAAGSSLNPYSNDGSWISTSSTGASNSWFILHNVNASMQYSWMIHALFSHEQLYYTITTSANSSERGTVSGGGHYLPYDYATLTATPNSGFHFNQWSDGNTQNPRTVSVTGDANYTAHFTPNLYSINVRPENPEQGTALGSGTYEYGSSVTISATPITGYCFNQWNDGSVQNPRTITVRGDATYIANFAKNKFTITAKPDYPSHGSVTGGGEYFAGEVATLTATPASGYRFSQWSDGSVQNPRNITVIQDAVYLALFAETNGIQSYEDDGISVYPNPASEFVIVNGTGILRIELLTSNGTVIRQSLNTNSVNLDNLEAGFYLLRIMTKEGCVTKKLIKE